MTEWSSSSILTWFWQTVTEMASSLAGLRVLEVGQFLAGPLAGMHLAAMQAEVIKIEKPRLGDGEFACVASHCGPRALT